MNKNDKILVSVFCFVYNHEKYVRQCLDSLLNQNTSFRYEILVNDDVSTDKTREILLEYQNRFPGIIRLFLQDENQYSKGRDMISLLLPYAKGKYVCLCEGDDYYLDETKLQRQFEMMEKYENCSLCVHKVQSVTESGEIMNHTTPNDSYTEGLKESKDIIGKMTYSYSFQTSSYFVRTDELRVLSESIPVYYKSIFQSEGVSDIPLFLYFAQRNKVYYIDRIMSAWRRNSIDGWSSKTTAEKRVRHYRLLNEMLADYDVYTGGRFQAELSSAQLHNSYIICSMTHDYRNMLKKEYREFFRTETARMRIYIYIVSIFPGFKNLYSFIKYGKHS